MTKNDQAPLDRLIHSVRGKRVMLDSDIARVYDVATRQLNQQVRRNLERFPEDFMFRLTREEADSLRSQSVTLKGRGRHRKYLPLAFTQEGVAMLSSVLRSPRAVAANIAIMRAFVRYRESLSRSRGLALKLKELESRVDRHDGDIAGLIDDIRGMVEGPSEPRKRIGFTAGDGDRSGREEKT